MRIAYCLLMILCTSAAHALEQQAQLWLDASINDDFDHYEKLEYNLEAQSRFVNEADYYKMSFLSGGLGYRPMRTLSFWSGYQWNAHNNIAGNAHENQIWEQVIWQVFNNDTVTIRTRTRLEQTNRVHEAQWNNRFREKISFYFPSGLFNKYTPLIYNEIFINLNDVDWLNSDTFAENRLFIGLDVPLTKISFLEVGYIQENLFNDEGNALNPVLYVGLNINPTTQPFAQYVR